MASITTRETGTTGVAGVTRKNLPLTNAEIDNNFISLNNSKLESLPQDIATTSNPQFSSLGLNTPASGVAGELRATGDVNSAFSSDKRFKENIQDVPNALNIVCAIGSKTFDWTDEYVNARGGVDDYFLQKSSFGVIAQDVQSVFPQAVKTRENGTLAVDYEKLSVLAFGAIKELLKRIEHLEGK